MNENLEALQAHARRVVRAQRYNLSANHPAQPCGERLRAFSAVRATLRACGVAPQTEHDSRGWLEIGCPWEKLSPGHHRAALRLPDEENSFFGQFTCSHEDCRARDYHELAILALLMSRSRDDE
jgi:hypothetical protein